MKNNAEIYEQPNVVILEVEIERGFAQSGETEDLYQDDELIGW